MDDELEDKVFYQTYISHMKILSKFVVGIPPINSSFAYLWKLLRLYLLRPEVFVYGLILFVFLLYTLLYLQAVGYWSRGLVGRITSSFGAKRSANRLTLLEAARNGSVEDNSWELFGKQSAAYAILGRRPKMEDRSILTENLNDTGVSFFAIFDGHGGEFAADFAKQYLVQNIYNKITESAKLLHETEDHDGGDYLSKLRHNRNKFNCGGKNDDGTISSTDDDDNNNNNNNNNVNQQIKENDLLKSPAMKRKQSFRKSYSTAEDCEIKGNCNRDDGNDVLLNKINSMVRTKENLIFGNDHRSTNSPVKPKSYEARCYLENGKINFAKIITDEVLLADYKLIAAAKKKACVAGTTALIAIVYGQRLIVANVGDSRGVMCDVKGKAIPLSFDHKPQQVRERKRIEEAGGYIALKGVWRVAGILATSRALGDYPLKDNNFVIADPDILTFDLDDHKPQFIILASDGLWDIFSNEEAVAYVKEHLNEPHYGAKSITLRAYNRGSVDNITVLIIVFKNGRYEIGSSSTNQPASINQNQINNIINTENNSRK